MPPIAIRKKYGHTVSAVNGSNKIIACSKIDWSPVKLGSLIVIEGAHDFYKIIKKEKTSYIKEIEVLNNNQFKIQGHTGDNLSNNDSISFTNNEYEAAPVFSILNGGSGYSEGDLLSPEGGICRYNSIDSIDTPTKLEVRTVDDNGSIEAVSIEEKGIYNVPPDLESKCSGGSGKEAIIELRFELAEKRSPEERSITDIVYKEDHTIIYVSHPMPPRVRAGIMSVSKWEATISAEYTGQTKREAGYEILKDFTPHLNLPLIRSDISSSNLLYNEAVTTLDRKIKELEEKIALLS